MKNDSTKPHAHRVLIVDDHPLVRHGLREMLSRQPDLQVVGECETANEAVRASRTLEPDLVMVDIALKDTNGLDLLKRLRKQSRTLKMLVLSMHDEAFFAERALRAGAGGYVSKQESPQRVIEAVQSVLKGGVYLSPEMTARILHGAPATAEKSQGGGLGRLTDRELEIFDSIGRGLSTRHIAETLQLSVKTVEAHRENIKRKLAIKDSSGLARRAYDWVLNRA
jgi:DNA-binding NarL/FixJ family response regulator